MSCGACCTGDSERHAEVTGDDYARIDTRERDGEGGAADWVAWTSNHAFMRMHDGRCAALLVRGERLSCAIYEERPAVCRALQADSPACEGERDRKLERTRRNLPRWAG